MTGLILYALVRMVAIVALSVVVLLAVNEGITLSDRQPPK